MAELQDLKRDFDISVQKIVTRSDANISEHIKNIENDILQTISVIEKEIGDDFEERTVSEMEKIFERNKNSREDDAVRLLETMASSLAGFDSEEAWELRNKLFETMGNKASFVSSLRGLDSERAWEMRKRLKGYGVSLKDMCNSLAGVDSDKAWEIREKLAKGHFGVKHDHEVALSLTGCNSDRAWKMRKRLTDSNINTAFTCYSINGLDSPQAWKIREDILRNNPESTSVILSLIGIDSQKAWAIREKFLGGIESGHHLVMLSLGGCDSERAWSLRDEAIKNDLIKHGEEIPMSLAGLDSERAWNMRKELSLLSIGDINMVSSMNLGFSLPPRLLTKNNK